MLDEVSDEHLCTAGCGSQEGRLYFIKCNAAALKVGHKQRIEKFKKVHKGLKTTGVIYHSFLSILQHLREGGDSPSFVSYYE